MVFDCEATGQFCGQINIIWLSIGMGKSIFSKFSLLGDL